MSLVVARLGERLRKISQEAQSSAAKLSAYLNEVFHAFILPTPQSCSTFD